MSTRTEIAGLLAEQLPTVADDATTEMFFAYQAMRDQRDEARAEAERLYGVEFIHAGCETLRARDNQCLIDQRDQARRFAVAFEQEANDAILRITNACALVDWMLEHDRDQCDCGDGQVCIVHKIDDALRGVSR